MGGGIGGGEDAWEGGRGYPPPCPPSHALPRWREVHGRGDGVGKMHGRGDRGWGRCMGGGQGVPTSLSPFPCTSPLEGGAREGGRGGGDAWEGGQGMPTSLSPSTRNFVLLIKACYVFEVLNSMYFIQAACLSQFPNDANVKIRVSELMIWLKLHVCVPALMGPYAPYGINRPK